MIRLPKLRRRSGEERGRGGASIWFLALVLLLSACRSSEPSNGNGFGAFEFKRVSGYVELMANLREETVEAKTTGQDRDSSEVGFEEAVALAFAGFMYHPTLIKYRLNTRGGLVQRSFKQTVGSNRVDESEFEPTAEFDFEAELLGKTRYPGRIFTSRTRDLDSREFQSSLETTTATYGMNWAYMGDALRASFGALYQDTDLSSLGQGLDVNRTRLSLKLDASYTLSSDSQVRATLEHRSMDETLSFRDIEADELNIHHRWRFGDGKRSSLLSYLHWLDQSGSLSIARTTLSESLILEITEDLRSTFSLTLRDQTQNSGVGTANVEDRSLLANGSLTHQLYRSLKTTLEGHFTTQDVGDQGSEENWSGALGFQYSKETSLGRFNLGYRVKFQRQIRDQTADARLQVLDEMQTFAAGLPVTLDNLKVDQATIFVTAPDNFTVYTAGIDYTVVSVGDQTQLARLPAGNILPGGAVLVDYIYSLEGDFDLDTTLHTLSVHHEFPFGLSAYFRSLSSNQSLRPGDAMGVTPEDFTTRTVGLRYRKDPFSIRAEYTDENSSVNSHEQLSVSAEYTKPLGDRSNLSLRTSYDRLVNELTELQETDRLAFRVSYNTQLSNRLSLTSGAGYSFGSSTTSGNESFADVNLDVRWNYGRLDVGLTGHYTFSDVQFSNRQAWQLILNSRLRF